MTALRWLQEHWLPVLVGALLSAIIYELLIRATPLQPAAAVGFMLSAILGGVLFVLFVGNALRVDGIDERMAALERRDAAVWEYLGIQEADGWPGDEPDAVEPPEPVLEMAEPDDAATEEFPAIPVTVPMEIAWDESAAELVVEEPQPAPVSDWRAEQDAWLQAEMARLNEMAKQ